MVVDEVQDPLPADVDLEAQGWARRSRATPEQAVELRRQYEELGFDVVFQKLTPGDFEDKCGSCGQSAACTLVVILTRKKGAASRS